METYIWLTTNTILYPSVNEFAERNESFKLRNFESRMLWRAEASWVRKKNTNVDYLTVIY